MKRNCSKRPEAVSGALSRALVGVRTWAWAVGLVLAGCGGSGGGGASDAFFVDSISVPEGATWPINRPIRVHFSQPVDFATVSLNSINLRALGGANVLGEFTLEDPQTVVFQPACPTMADFSDAALQPGGVSYELSILGSDEGLAFTVESMDGERPETSARRSFLTPTSLSPPELFYDPVVGAPRPILRGRNAADDELLATHVELGGDSAHSSRLYYRDTGGHVGLFDALGNEVSLPLNFYSQPQLRLAIVLYLDQPVMPSLVDTGLAVALFEYEASAGNWITIPAEVELVANCTSTGAVLRLVPEGLLAPGAPTRVVLTTGLEDLVGESNVLPLIDFATCTAASAPVQGALRDEILEPFDVSAADDPARSLEDANAVLANAPASWGAGRLAPGFDFSGTGGPGTDFDVSVAAGQTVIWNTSSQILTGGPNFAPTKTATMIGGVFNLRRLRVESGATLSFEGPNPVQVFATGDITIDGRVLVNGGSNFGVIAIANTDQAEAGAVGQCGGGTGGMASGLVGSKTPRGGTGFAAGDLLDTGGFGGESGWTTDGNLASTRRAGGGGGGVLGANQMSATPGIVDERYVGLNAEPGFVGSFVLDDQGVLLGAFGAENPEDMEAPPEGGQVGRSPFVDGDPTNDFFGRRVELLTNTVISGELSGARAGAGGGGGGDSSRLPPGAIYPGPYDPATGTKGGGGGGGGGAISMLALGTIRFGLDGQLQCRGGFGGTGESTGALNRIGGGGGGGSGGHVILESATSIDFSAKALGEAGVPAILATGGQGAGGANSDGGATISGEIGPDLDACHLNSPPFDSDCPTGDVEGAGGDGGPGIVQLHTPLGTIGLGGDIVVPPTVSLDELSFPAPLPPLVPRFGRRSRSRSVWVRLGQGGFDPFAPSNPTPPSFSFAGTDPATGSIVVNGDVVPALPELVPAQIIVSPGNGLPFVAADGRTLVMSDAGFAPELIENPDLLNEFLIDLDPPGGPGLNTVRFTIVSALHDAATSTFQLTAPLIAGNELGDFAQPGMTEVRVRPVFFRIQSSGQLDRLPANVEIRVWFEAAPLDPVTAGPDESNASGMLTDIAGLNQPASNGAPYEFLRFEVQFDVDKNGQGFEPTQTDINLDFLRLPFEY